MPEAIVNQKPAVPPRATAEDLSKEIEHSMERKSNEHIKVVRVFDDCYRCNWWASDSSTESFWLAGGTIRKSRFVRATKTTDGLQIKDVTQSRSDNG